MAMIEKRKRKKERRCERKEKKKRERKKKKFKDDTRSLDGLKTERKKLEEYL